MTQVIEKKALSPRDVSEMYGISEGTLANWRVQKRGPRFFKMGRKKIVYFQNDLDSWAHANPVNTTESEGV